MCRSSVAALIFCILMLGSCSATRRTSLETAASTTPSGATDKALMDLGRRTFKSAGCIECHRREGQGKSLAPDLDLLAGRVDPTYVRESILEPRAVIVPGYPDVQMPEDYGTYLTEEELDALQYYLSNHPSN